MAKKILRIVILLAIVGVAGFGIARATRNGKGNGGGLKLVEIDRGTIVDKAVATGQIVPLQEIQVKSQISGIVKRCFVEVGDAVAAGDPLFAIIPDPTPLELNEAERKVELAEVAWEKARLDFARNRSLHEEGILSKEAYDASKRTHDEARIQLEMARERLQLTREGKIKRAVGGVDSVIRAPEAGTVLQRHVNPGDPVVPLTSYQAGTPLATMADMDTLLFRGTVDEIDVGKLKVGLPVRIKVGALPDAEVTGRLTRIAPKATEKEGTTLFDVEASLDAAGETVLRAGYSANADVIIQEKKDVVLVPERLVTFEKDLAFVELPPVDPKAEPQKKEIKVGLSDGMNVEVLEGLAQGDKVVQRPPKEIK